MTTSDWIAFAICELAGVATVILLVVFSIAVSTNRQNEKAEEVRGRFR